MAAQAWNLARLKGPLLAFVAEGKSGSSQRRLSTFLTSSILGYTFELAVGVSARARILVSFT